MKITKTFYNVGGKLVTERELNAAKKFCLILKRRKKPTLWR